MYFIIGSGGGRLGTVVTLGNGIYAHGVFARRYGFKRVGIYRAYVIFLAVYHYHVRNSLVYGIPYEFVTVYNNAFYRVEVSLETADFRSGRHKAVGFSLYVYLYAAFLHFAGGDVVYGGSAVIELRMTVVRVAAIYGYQIFFGVCNRVIFNGSTVDYLYGRSCQRFIYIISRLAYAVGRNRNYVLARDFKIIRNFKFGLRNRLLRTRRNVAAYLDIVLRARSIGIPRNLFRSYAQSRYAVFPDGVKIYVLIKRDAFIIFISEFIRGIEVRNVPAVKRFTVLFRKSFKSVNLAAYGLNLFFTAVVVDSGGGVNHSAYGVIYHARVNAYITPYGRAEVIKITITFVRVPTYERLIIGRGGICRGFYCGFTVKNLLLRAVAESDGTLYFFKHKVLSAVVSKVDFVARYRAFESAFVGGKSNRAAIKRELTEHGFRADFEQAIVAEQFDDVLSVYRIRIIRSGLAFALRACRAGVAGVAFIFFTSNAEHDHRQSKNN